MSRVHELLEDRFDFRVIAAEREDAPAGEQVEVFVAVGVPQVAAFAARVGFIEADRAEHFDEGRIDVLGMQVVLAALLLVEPLEEIGFHGRDYSGECNQRVACDMVGRKR